MKRLRLWIRNAFGFSNAETNGFLILLPAMILILFSQPIYQFFNPVTLPDPALNRKLDSLVALWNFNPSDSISIQYFPFDPNSASVQDLKSLGFPSFLADRIINYREKGGRFKQRDDLLKIYGMDSGLFALIYPHIVIEAPTAPTGSIAKIKEEVKSAPIVESFDLNIADTAVLKSIRGIGPVLASRIVQYRHLLGGYVTVDQLKEVYGLDTAVIREVKKRAFIKEDFKPKRFDLNKVSEREFSGHPYIKSKLAKTIVAYRFQHGSFTQIDDLLKIDIIDQQILNNIRPYLKIEP